MNGDTTFIMIIRGTLPFNLSLQFRVEGFILFMFQFAYLNISLVSLYIYL